MPGCGFFGTGVPAGTLVGTVLWAGQPAVGKVVELQVLSGGTWSALATPTSRATDGLGKVRFSGLSAGTYRLHYASPQPEVERPAQPAANEVLTWDTQGASVGGSGASLPPFDLAFDDLIYPANNGSTLTTATGSSVPFHWAAQPSARHYQVQIFPGLTGGTGFSATAAFTSPWGDDPFWTFKQVPPSGVYAWQVFMDGGDAGVGASAKRQVGF